MAVADYDDTDTDAESGYSLEGPAQEIENGLPNERDRLTCAQTNLAYYHRENADYIERRPAEEDIDYQMRPKRTLDLVPQVVNALCKHQYQPPPARQIENSPAIDAWLQAVLRDNHFNARMHKCEIHSTLNSACALQVAATGDPRRPIKLHRWGAESLAVWEDPDDPARPWCVCTIDRFDARTRYRLYNDTSVWTFLTEKFPPDQAGWGRKAKLVSAKAHGYGVLPFSFVHYELPDDCFWGANVGDSIRRANAWVDAKLSDLADAEQKLDIPHTFIWNVKEDWKPTIRPGAFVHVPRPASSLGLKDASEPHFETPQYKLDIEGGWYDVREYVLEKIESLDVPRSAVRMEQSGFASGIALVIEQAPLLTRAQNRRPDFQSYESDAFRVILAVGGNYYDRPELVAASEDVQATWSWAEPTIPIPGPDRDANDLFETQQGYTSLVMVVMRRYGMSREQAIAHLEQVAEDNKVVAALFPGAAAAGETREPQASSDGDRNGDEATGGGRTDPGEGGEAEADTLDNEVK